MAKNGNNVQAAIFPRNLVTMVSGDILVSASCFLFAVLLCLGSGGMLYLRYENGFLRVGIACVTCLLFLYMYDYYNSRIFSSFRELTTRVPQLIGSIMIVLGLLYYLEPHLALGRGILIFGLTGLSLCLVLYRIGFLWLTRISPLREKTVLVGEGRLAKELADEIRNHPECGLDLEGMVSENGQNPEASQDFNAVLPVLGSTENLAQLIKDSGCQRVILAVQDRRGKLPLHDLLWLKGSGITVDDGVEFYERLTGKLAIADVTPGWLVFTDGFHISHLQRALIRLTSLVIAFVALALASPLLLLLAIIVKLDSPGPIFFKQERVGQNGKTFQIIKFRSMRHNCEAQTGPTWATKDDPRTTRLGKYFRRFYLDELPQLFNVLRGDMSLVGPRPERPFFVDQLRQKIPFYDLRHIVRPGVTGWGQVSYGYAGSEQSHMERVQYDLFYCKNRSVGLDLLILFQTAKTMMLARGSR
jgi:sugar transferase (PEP-CTERM system associated)